MYHFIDHTADIGIEVESKDLFELIEDIIEAFRDIMTEEDLKCMTEKEIILQGSEEELIYDLLSEMIYLFDTESLIPVKVERIEIKDRGKEKTYQIHICFDNNKHKITNYIKAVTLHDFFVGKINGKYKAKILFDV